MAKIGEFVWAKRRWEFNLEESSFPDRKSAIEDGFINTKNKECYYTGRVQEFRFAENIDLTPILKDFERKAILSGVPYQTVARYVDGLDEEDLRLLCDEIAEAAKEIFPAILAVSDIEWHWHTELLEGKEAHPLVSENGKLKETIEKLNRQLEEAWMDSGVIQFGKEINVEKM